ncbi:thrombospondin type-1 domain-containing protein 4-like [Protopterus annectens]|uniref:thrombospondin type-1 domain-containing protein 4-like n=1 Tax=Protopterus annectens TaxID=7888 RepID=UPI001CFB4333|nr:thrombospondin type-1 domain-containing protein 4-like [Protopterus annectens]
MTGHFITSLCLFVVSVTLLGFQLVAPQLSAEHRKVPQRIEEKAKSAEEINSIPGIWGSWGPWSACSRTCSGGVMEQTRPCLPAHYSERPHQRQGQQYLASERTHSHQYSYHQEDSVNPYPGHAVSTIRTSVALHRNRGELRVGHQSSVSRGHNDTVPSQALLRGSQQPHSEGQKLKAERRNKTRNSIVPGRYGYGKIPYTTILQTDSEQTSKKKRRQRQLGRHQGNQNIRGHRQRGYNQHITHVSHSHHQLQGNSQRIPSSQHLNLYQSSHISGPRQSPPSSSVYQQPSSNSNTVSVSGINVGLDSSSHSSGSQQPMPDYRHGTTSISCVGSYKQHKLCNSNPCPENSRNIREVQCSSYNSKPFMGQYYEWEPFNEVVGHQSCELNCRALGYRFYVRQADKVIDGTPCEKNGTAICVSGKCKLDNS